jgi:ionotropic glutamate receptor
LPQTYNFTCRILDRFSPYSYCNNKEAYPEGARDFTLGESIWFALTSLTPQGGGECPKALSGRILVAAYWLFIVLMLATFTANLVRLFIETKC